MKINGRNSNKQKAVFIVHNKKFVCITLLFIVLSCSFPAQIITENKNSDSTTDSKIKQINKYSFKIIELQDKTFGYDIYRNDRLLIHQSSIPAMAGDKGFIKSASAQRIARLVIYKLKNGEMPPSVTTEDLKKLNAI